MRHPLQSCLPSDGIVPHINNFYTVPPLIINGGMMLIGNNVPSACKTHTGNSYHIPAYISATITLFISSWPLSRQDLDISQQIGQGNFSESSPVHNQRYP